MAAIMRIDQGTVGVNDQSRIDGLSDGTPIVVTNVEPGASNDFFILWAPLEQDPLPTVSGTSPTWSFSMTPGVWGPVLLGLLVDGELAVREIVIPSPVRGLILPSLNEVGDIEASLIKQGIEQIKAATNNAPIPGTRLSGGNYAAYWPHLDKIYRAVEASAPTVGLNAAVKTAMVPFAETASRTLSLADFPDNEHGWSYQDTITAITITVDEDAAVDVPIGRSRTFERIEGSSPLTFAGNGAANIRSLGSLSGVQEGGTACLVKVRANDWKLTGELE